MRRAEWCIFCTDAQRDEPAFPSTACRSAGLTSTTTRTVIVSAPANDDQASRTPANDNPPPSDNLSATGTE